MIRELKSKGRLLFISREWLNSIVRWICGIYSPDGSIIVRNTSDPKAGGGSLGLSVNIPSVSARVRKAIFGDNRPLTRDDVKEIVRNSADGNSIKGDGAHLAVNAEWLKQMVETTNNNAEPFLTEELTVLGYPQYNASTLRYTFPVYELSINNGKIKSRTKKNDLIIDLA